MDLLGRSSGSTCTLCPKGTTDHDQFSGTACLVCDSSKNEFIGFEGSKLPTCNLCNSPDVYVDITDCTINIGPIDIGPIDIGPINIGGGMMRL